MPTDVPTMNMVNVVNKRIDTSRQPRYILDASYLSVFPTLFSNQTKKGPKTSHKTSETQSHFPHHMSTFYEVFLFEEFPHIPGYFIMFIFPALVASLLICIMPYGKDKVLNLW